MLSEIYYIGIICGNSPSVYSLSVVVKRNDTKSKRILLNGVR